MILRLCFADGSTEIILCPFSCPDVSAPGKEDDLSIQRRYIKNITG
jgi:hypothetical protein